MLAGRAQGAPRIAWATGAVAVGLLAVLVHQSFTAEELLHSTGFLGAAEARSAFILNLALVLALVALTALVPARRLGIPIAGGAAVLTLTACAVAIPGGQAWPIVIAVGTLAALWYIGDTALALARFESGNLRTQGIVSLALGTGAAGAALLIVGYVGIVRWWTVGIATVGLGLAGIIRFLRSRATAIAGLPRSLTSSRIRAGIAGLLCIQGSWALVWAAAPEVMYDPLYGKAWIPAQWASSGAALGLADYPQNGVAGIGPILAVPGHALGAPDVGRYLQYFLAVVLVCVAWRVVDAHSRLLAPIAAAIIATAPQVIWQAGSANDDLLVSVVALGAALAVMRLWREVQQGTSATDLVIGALVGTCLITKLHLGYFALALGAAWVVARAVRSASWWRPLSFAGIGSFVVAAPDFLFRWFDTGNPLFPFYNAVFRSRYWPVENTNFDFPYLKAHDLRTLVGLPWRILDQPATLLQTAPSGAFGLLIVPLLLALILGWRRPSGERVVWIALIVAVVFWWLDVRYLRYLLPYAVIATVCAPSLLRSTRSIAVRRATQAVAIVSVGVAFAVFFATTLAQYWNVPGLKPPTDVAFGLESRAHYEHRAFPELEALEAFNRLAGPNSGAAVDGRWTYQRTEVREDLDLEPFWLVQTRLDLPINRVDTRRSASASGGSREPGDIEFSRYRELNLNWIFLGNDDRALSLEPVDRAQLIQSHGVIRFAANGFDLYELVRRPSDEQVVEICDPKFSESDVCWVGLTSDGSPGLAHGDLAFPAGVWQPVAVCPGETLTLRPSVSGGPVDVSVGFLRGDGTPAEWRGDRMASNALTIQPETGDALHATAPLGSRSAIIQVTPSATGVVDELRVGVSEPRASSRTRTTQASVACASRD